MVPGRVAGCWRLGSLFLSPATVSRPECLAGWTGRSASMFLQGNGVSPNGTTDPGDSKTWCRRRSDHCWAALSATPCSPVGRRTTAVIKERTRVCVAPNSVHLSRNVGTLMVKGDSGISTKEFTSPQHSIHPTTRLKHPINSPLVHLNFLA